jgi:hypothetical protein
MGGSSRWERRIAAAPTIEARWSTILHPSVCMLHMASIAHRIGNRKVRFDATTERFDDAEANALIGRVYRPEYRVPETV